MVSLYNLFVNKNNKPTKNIVSYAYAKQHEDKQRTAQIKAWKDAGAGKSLEKESIIKQDKKKKSGNSSDEYDSSGDGSYGDSDSSGGNSVSEEEQEKEELRKKALDSIKNMKDSNISSTKRFDYEDLWNQSTIVQQNAIWGLKEEVFLYTFHDKQQHRYLNSINIDCDKSDILGTCQIYFPYDQQLMEYWIPAKTTFAIVGGTFDREILFVGNVAEINQRGDQIEMVGHNVGWKFKAYMSSDFEKSLENLSVKDAVKVIFQKLGFTKGRYHIDLDGIPNLDKYVIGENFSIDKDGEQVQNVPELTEVVKNLQSYNIDKYIEKKSETREVQEVADDYDKKTKMSSLDRVINANTTYYPSAMRQNYGIKTTYKEENLLYEPILEKIQGTEELGDFLVKGYSGDGENTYEDILKNIAAAIDAHFFIVDTTVCFMSFNALLANSSIVQKAVMPTIDFWQLQEGSYELNANQYGYYNTVEVKYKNGTVTRCYDDLVKIFGEIKITYEEKNLDYEAAMLKAQAYLSAHIRDFGMELKATILYSGKITPSNFIKLKNPLTMSEGLFFIQGTSIQWSADNQTLICDLDLRFGPENPDGLEVPEVGTSYESSDSVSVTGNVPANVAQAAKQMINGYTSNDAKALAIYNWVDQNVTYEFYYGHKYSDADMLSGSKRANCYDTAYLIYRLCTAVNVKCEVWNGTYHFLDRNYGHLWNKIYYKGEMKFADTGRESRNPIGEHGSGRYIISGSCVAKNY